MLPQYSHQHSLIADAATAGPAVQHAPVLCLPQPAAGAACPDLLLCLDTALLLDVPVCMQKSSPRTKSQIANSQCTAPSHSPSPFLPPCPPTQAGFWHSHPQSPQVHECPLPRSCITPHRAATLAAFQKSFQSAQEGAGSTNNSLNLAPTPKQYAPLSQPPLPNTAFPFS